jgi:hypothetical protein
MPSLPFMSMEPFIEKGDSLTWEEKMLNMDKKFLKLLEAVWAPKRVSHAMPRTPEGGDNSCSGKPKG